MKDICIIAPSSIRLMPYLRCYEAVLHGTGISYDVVYWDRYQHSDTRDSGFAFVRDGTAQGVRLIPGYLAYRRHIVRHLRSNSYKMYIVFTTQLGVLLFDILRKSSYILDIRDYSHENWRVYRYAEKRIIRNAMQVSISSPGFREWLPQGIDYTLSHNLSFEQLRSTCDGGRPFNPSTQVLSYIGMINYYDANIKVIEALRNQRGVSIRYVGEGGCQPELQRYCRVNDVQNVSFLGRFRPEEKRSFYLDTNFVLCCYGSDSNVVRSLLPNRLYESCLYKRPIVVNRGTYLSEVVRSRQIGVVVDLGDLSGATDALREYYDETFFDEYSRRCDEYLASVESDMKVFENRTREVIARVL